LYKVLNGEQYTSSVIRHIEIDTSYIIYTIFNVEFLRMNLKKFNELSPAEVSTLTLATDLGANKNSDPIILTSAPTLVLISTLAEGLASRRGDIDYKKTLDEIKDFSYESAKSLSSRNFYVRHDYTVRNLLKNLNKIGFPILPPGFI